MIDLVRPLKEIKKSGLEKYYWYFEERAAIREFDGETPKVDVDRQAMNDTVYLFMEDNNLDVTSVEVNQFIKKMVI